MMQAIAAATTLLLTVSASGQQWSAPVSIITGSQLEEARHNTTPKVAVDPDGNIAVAWISQHREGTSITERLFSNVHVAYSSTGGQVWTAPEEISERAYYNSEVDITAGSANEFLFAWTSGDLFSTYRLHNGFSTDGGATYTTETIVGQGPGNEYDHLYPQVIKSGSARIMAKSSWSLTYNPYYTPGFRRIYNMGGHIWRREQDAPAWKQAALADDPSSFTECHTLSVDLLNAGASDLIAVFHQDYFETEFRQRALVLTSADSGNNWVSRGRVTPATLQLRELAAAHGANGTSIIAGTEESLDVDTIWVARSSDKGASWPTATGLSQPAGTVDYVGQPSIATDGNGTWLLALYGEHMGSSAPSYGADGDIFYTMSADDGLTWTNASAVNTDADADAAADTTPQAAYFGAGRWGIFWSRREAGETSNIVFSAFDIEGASVADWQLF